MPDLFTLPDRLLYARNNVCTLVVLCILLAAAYGQSRLWAAALGGSRHDC